SGSAPGAAGLSGRREQRPVQLARLRRNVSQPGSLGRAARGRFLHCFGGRRRGWASSGRRGSFESGPTCLEETGGRISGQSGGEEPSLAEELAHRAALAIDNAGLYKVAQKARAESERANLAKDSFLAMLSHELRTPLTPVLTSVLTLEQAEALPEDVRESLQMIRRNVELESRLIDDLLY